MNSFKINFEMVSLCYILKILYIPNKNIYYKILYCCTYEVPDKNVLAFVSNNSWNSLWIELIKEKNRANWHTSK
jgi:hypothetical protein